MTIGVIAVEPLARARARTIMRNGHTWSYIPKEQEEYENAVIAYIKTLGIIPFAEHVPVHLTVTFYRRKPTSIPKHETKPVRKPDADNFLKGFCEILTKSGVIADDSQITTVTMQKAWSSTESGYTIFCLEDDSKDSPLFMSKEKGNG